MNINSNKENIAYIGLGSNLDNPKRQIKNAISALSKVHGVEVLNNSGYFQSKPMGPADQPDYLNSVVEIKTTLSAEQLLESCQKIEKQQGRVKTRHWGERTLDLDILLYEEQQIETPELTIPHPGICSRDFVYMPLLAINAEVSIPGKGILKTIVESDAAGAADFSCEFVGKIE